MLDLTFDRFDKFNRKPFAERLTKAITTFYPFYDGAYVLSLNAQFGSGKTTFLKMWKSHLEEQEFKVIYLNAWENDFDDEPLISIATGILDEIEGNDNTSTKAKSALRGVTGVAALISNAALAGATGINVKEILDEVEKDLQNGEIQRLGDIISEAYTVKKLLYSKLRSSLSAYLEKLPHKPLIVLVDELDRVRPDYAVKFLEAIKHIFSVQGVCFVLAVDRRQLEAFVRQLYGSVDFDNYYRRFVVREANLPNTGTPELFKFMQQLNEEYFGRKDRAGIPIFLNELQRASSLEWISSLCYSLQLTPRQTEHLFRIFIQFLAVEKEGQSARDAWIRASLFMIALSVSSRIDIYTSLGSGVMSPAKLHEFVETLKFGGRNKKSDKRYLILTALAFMLTAENSAFSDEAIDAVIAMDAIPSPDREKILGSISKVFDSPWGELPYEASGFQAIYKKLEEWKDFLDPDT